MVLVCIIKKQHNIYWTPHCHESPDQISAHVEVLTFEGNFNAKQQQQQPSSM